MDQARSAPRHRLRQAPRGPSVAGVVVPGPQRLGDARQVDHALHVAQRSGDSLSGRQVAVHQPVLLQVLRATGAPHQATVRKFPLIEKFHHVVADETGRAGDEEHYCGALRKATCPK